MSASESSVLRRIADGDPKAVADCMRQYGGLVWSIARRFSESPADAEDAVQEIFVDLWKSARRYDESIANESVFIATVARRRLIDKLRAGERRPRTEELDEATAAQLTGPEGDDPAVAAEAAIASRAVSELDEAQQQILLMGIVGGLTHSEIAATTGRPLGTVKTQMRRGLARVRALLAEDDVPTD